MEKSDKYHSLLDLVLKNKPFEEKSIELDDF